MRLVLDACTMIAFLRGETGADVVRDLLADPTNSCYAHAVNMCEVYYDFLRASDSATALRAIADLRSVGVIVSEDMDTDFWQEAGRYKGSLRRISLADCFALALTRRLEAELVTSDHVEFEPVATLGICPIRFFR